MDDVLDGVTLPGPRDPDARCTAGAAAGAVGALAMAVLFAAASPADPSLPFRGLAEPILGVLAMNGSTRGLAIAIGLASHVALSMWLGATLESVGRKRFPTGAPPFFALLATLVLGLLVCGVVAPVVAPGVLAALPTYALVAGHVALGAALETTGLIRGARSAFADVPPFAEPCWPATASEPPRTGDARASRWSDGGEGARTSHLI